MAKVKYSGPPGFAVVGSAPFVPGETTEVSDEVALGLEGHQWFEVSGVSKKAREEAEEAEPEEEPDESP